MQEAGLEPEEIALALHIHLQAKLHFSIADHDAEIPLLQGIRQGCGLSPLLWALATARLHLVYGRTVTQRREPVGEPTLYADDVWASWIIRTQEQFKSSLRAAGTLIQVLQEAGLRVSPTKTVILLHLQGTAVRSTLKPRLVQLEGDEQAVRIRVGQTQLPIKLVQTHTYLGARINYTNLENTNLQHRIHSPLLAGLLETQQGATQPGPLHDK